MLKTLKHIRRQWPNKKGKVNIMAVTKLENLVNPEVMGDMINAKIEAQLKITPYAKVDTTLQGVAGDTKTVPSWNYIGDAEDVAEGEEVGLSQMTSATTTFTIKKAMKAVGITQEAINSGLGNPVGQAEKQLAQAIAGKVDADVLEAAYDSANVYDGSSAVIGYDPIVNAVTKFEDEEDGIEKVMFIHPKQEATLLQDADFLSADKFTAGVAVNGAIGKVAGCWVKKSKKVVTVDETQGSRTVTIASTVVAGEKFSITVMGKKYEFTVGDTTTVTAVAAGLVALITADTAAKVTATNSSGVITLAEATGYYGISLETVPVLATNSVAGTITAGGTYSGSCAFKCPIIKMEPDSPETEYTEDELPAVTIFLKKDTTVDHEWFPKRQQHDITAARYYGVALTNGAKVVLAKFKK